MPNVEKIEEMVKLPRGDVFSLHTYIIYFGFLVGKKSRAAINIFLFMHGLFYALLELHSRMYVCSALPDAAANRM
jgi:hypothetical protein